jgi:signal transduction histidine kinase
MKRRLLLSYLSLTALILLFLEVPLGVIYARREHDTLIAAARRDASALAVAAAENLESPSGESLAGLASRYRIETGSEVAIFDAQCRPIVGFDAGEPGGSGGTEPNVTSLVEKALRGQSSTARRTDDNRPQLLAAQPAQVDGKTVGAVVVAISAASTDSRILRAWVGLGGLAAALLGLAALVGLLLARSLTAPLVRLQHTAKRFGRGELDARVPSGGPAELAALADEFNAMAERVHQLVETQRRFVADASHQLRTPLTALRLRLENLAASTDSPDAGELEAAEAETQRLARLVDGLLTLSRAQDHLGNREPVDVMAVARDRRDAWLPLAEERGISLVVEGQADRARALAVPGHLEQILDNLLSNAVEATPPGTQVAIVVEEPTNNGDPAVVVHVRDQGPGMTPSEREHAFDRFWQGQDRVGGTGLGLAIVQQLAESSGGNVELGEGDGGGLDAAVTLVSR